MMTATLDPFRLQRFLDAQAPVYAQALDKYFTGALDPLTLERL